MERRVVQVEPGLLRIDQRLRMEGRETGTDVSGPACIYALVRVERGVVAYVHGSSHVRAPRAFAVFLPPFAIVQASLEGIDVTSAALAFRPRGPDRLPDEPLLLPSDGAALPRAAEETIDRVLAATTVASIGRARDPGGVAANAKTIIDREYRAPLAIARVAARLRTSPAVLSRAFKRTYGMPPVRYRHHVRIMEALLHLAEGAAPIDVFQDVGFDDLSRFYKVFRQISCAAPGSYRPGGSRIAKT